MPVGSLLRPGPTARPSCARTARLIARIASRNICGRTNVLVRCPTHAPSNQQLDPWSIWDNIRCLSGYKPGLGVALEVHGGDIEPHDAHSLERWVAEPVHVLLLHSSVFENDAGGEPVLPPWIRNFVERMVQCHVQLVLTLEHTLQKGKQQHDLATTPEIDETRESSRYTAGEVQQYRQQLVNLFQQLPALSHQERIEAPYRDYLQSPLQPLSDNLESQTYEVFERDEAKYNTYSHAISKALSDLTKSTSHISALVAGAGRGPLVLTMVTVAKALGFALGGTRKSSTISVSIIALEKNPNAVLTLSALCRKEGWSTEAVKVEEGDLRSWNGYPADGIDLVVSELLGSFGDNELSPECLDGANRFLKPHSIVIPRTYSSHVAPLASAILHASAHALSQTTSSLPSSTDGGVQPNGALETHYVVKLHRSLPLDEPKQMWRFDHGPEEVEKATSNDRYGEAEFENVSECTMAVDGLVGYFDAELYGGVHCSIHPDNHTEEMFSWFPMYFPFKQSVRVRRGESLRVHMWRCIGARAVWLEWAYTEPHIGHIHNLGGRAYAMSCS